MKSNIEVLVNIGLGERAKDDALLVRDTCTILLTLSKSEEKVGNRNKICCKLSKKKSPKSEPQVTLDYSLQRSGRVIQRSRVKSLEGKSS